MKTEEMRKGRDENGDVVVMQVPSTSKASAPVETPRPEAESSKNVLPARSLKPRADTNQRRTSGISEVLALREGEALPEGYRYVYREPGKRTGEHASTAAKHTETVDLSTPADGGVTDTVAEAEAEKRAVTARRNATRNSNKKAHASYLKEVKEALATGRQPTLKVSEDETHLKTRWHSAAKECAYKFLDLRKQSWKSYSHWDKEKVHRELKEVYKFDPPLDPKRVEKYLSSHLRSARAVWKAHWQKYGPENRHPNCREDAWEKLTKWWPTEECMEEAAEMAARRSLVQRGSNTGRKALIDRMDEVSNRIIALWMRHASNIGSF